MFLNTALWLFKIGNFSCALQVIMLLLGMNSTALIIAKMIYTLF